MGKLKATVSEARPAAKRGDGGATLAARASAERSEGHPTMSAVGTGSSPLTNRGELEALAIADHSDVSLVMADSGELKVVSVRVPTNGQVAIIDGLRVVIGEETFLPVVDGVDDEAFVRATSAALEEVFGFGLTRNLGQRRDFYGETWELGDNWGHVGFGGAKQNSTILISLAGQGTIAAKPGWEGRLHTFLTTRARRPVITRVDLAHDWFHGEVTVDQLDQMHTDGFFTNAYTIPCCQHAGDWKNPSGKGRTVYIGTRKAGLMFRGYEKGMEQGDSTSPWVRGEVEMSNKSRLIPFDVLVDPSGYFMGAYKKAFALLNLTVTPQRAEIKRKNAEISVDASLKLLNTQFGKYIGVLADFFGAEELVQKTRNRLGDWPKRLKVPDYFYADTPVHRQERRKSFNEFKLDSSDYSGALGMVV
ncbi:replication initiation factor domain-containing protein [Cupriavidus basilensis]|uniref:Replication initiation factor domain-containing protein n=1 Tax=Cupriavidus basilensis TaxID=68895 RepID=A0ABT6AGV2_9BURK|nr:replication initiation factor domain-containing protein [Cupriavidus basilensis]MDF3831826.1 replication initiation factor domain-containing protein [Cupriavidus basilensis]